MKDKEEIKALIDLLSHLNHKQWEMIKTIVDMAYDEKIKNEKINLAVAEKLICEDLIKNGL